MNNKTKIFLSGLAIGFFAFVGYSVFAVTTGGAGNQNINIVNSTNYASSTVISGGGTGNYDGFGAMVVHNNNSALNWDTVFFQSNEPTEWWAYYVDGGVDLPSFNIYSYFDTANVMLRLGAGADGIRINPNAGGITKIGSGVTSTPFLSGRDDLLVTGKTEFGGTGYFVDDVGIGTSTIDNSAILQLESTTQGMLPPRMTTVQRDAISSPADGLFIYNTSQDTLNWYDEDGGLWEEGGVVAYGEMYMVDNTTDTVIVEQNVWQPIAGVFTQGDLSGFTFATGTTEAFTAVADAGGGEITITANAHGLSAGDYITITGTTNYNGRYEVNSINTNDFNVTATYVATESGTAIRGDAICIDESSTELKISYGGSMTAGNNKIFEFALVKNALLCEKCRVQRKFGVAGDYGDLNRSSLVGNGVGVSGGDCFYMMTRNITDATDLTIKHANFNMVRL